MASRLALLTGGLLAVIYAGTAVSLLERRSSFAHAQQAEVDARAALLGERAANAFHSVDASLQRVASDLAGIGRAGGPVTPGQRGTPAGAALHDGLQAELRSLQITRALFVLDARGAVIGSSLRSAPGGSNFADRDYFKAFRDGHRGLYPGNLTRAREDALWFFSLARDARGADGTLLGVVVAAIDPHYFPDFLGSSLSGGAAMLVRDDGSVMVGGPDIPNGAVLPTPAGEFTARVHLADLPFSVVVSRPPSDTPPLARAGLLWLIAMLGVPSILAIGLTRKVIREGAARDRAERRLQDALESAPAAFALFDRDDRLVTCNAVFRDTYAGAGVAADNWTRWRARRAAAAGADEDIELLLSDGRWLLIREHRTSDGDRVCFHTDVTALKRQEQTLRRTGQQLRDAHRLAGIAYWERDLETDRLSWPTDMPPINGAPELTPQSFGAFLEMIHPDDRAAVLTARADETGVVRYEVRLRAARGELRHFYVEGHEAHDVRGSASQPIRRYGICRDITEVRRNEQMLRDLASNNRLLSQAVASSATAILIADPTLDDLPIVYVNPAFRSLTGYEDADAVGRNCRFLQGPETAAAAREALRAAIAEQRSIRLEILNYRKDGSPFWNELTISPVFEDDGALIAFLGMLKDVSRDREQEQVLRQRQKLEALGRMAGGIAHELNNLLHPIMTFGKLTLEELDPADEPFEYITYVLDSARQARDVVRKILAFARADQQPVVQLDFPETVRAAVDFATKLLPPSVETTVDIVLDGGQVLASTSDVAQVVANLVHNAAQAMDGAGRLSIRLTRADPADPDLCATAKQGFYRLTIADTGVGMSEEVRRRIFDPFFTTKPVGQGTGLGLSIVYGAVQSWRGTLEVTSQLGAGSAFSIFVPIVDAQSGAASALASETSA